ncbi:MAG TPA: glutathione S-transferase family protein [Gammaproteobacteria bacterium]|nr:glutathione S-transferase family protein [Gammaproteobacteria bacterium]
MRFYDFKGAPSPTKVRIVIAEKGLEIPTDSINLRELEQQREAYRAKNPAATVPMLELDDGTRLTESLAISAYLDRVYPEPNLMGETPAESALVLMWHDITMLEGYLGVQELLRNSSEFFKGRALPGLHPYEQIPALVDRGRRRVGIFLDKLDQRLGECPYVACGRYTYADVAAYVTVGFARRALDEDPAAGRAHVARWLDVIGARPAVQAATQ